MANVSLRRPLRGLSDAQVASRRYQKASRAHHTVARAEAGRVRDGNREKVLNAILAPLTALALVRARPNGGPMNAVAGGLIAP